MRLMRERLFDLIAAEIPDDIPVDRLPDVDAIVERLLAAPKLVLLRGGGVMPERQKIYAQKGGTLNDQERLELCRLLVKAGYTVRITAEKPNGSGTAVRVVEYWRS